ASSNERDLAVVQAEREFLFNQVEGLLSAALQLTAAADEVAAGQARGESSDRELRRAEEGFVLRIHILEELRLTAGHGEGNRELIEFAAVLGPMARARGELEIEGRSALARSIFDGSDEVTARFLADLAGRVHGHGEIEELGLQASDGRSTSEAFWEHSSIAERLKANLSVAGWKPTINESLRLILPFARLSLGWWELYLDGEGTAVGLHDRYYDPREAHPHPFAEAWLDEWPDRFARVDEDMDDLLAPETAADMLWNSFRAEFIRRFLALVTESRSRLPERAPQRPDGGA
ncbi:MAG: hypothetical protein Q4G64_06515, partial [bacterium]|nr:hypothetical protein [bacterium]